MQRLPQQRRLAGASEGRARVHHLLAVSLKYLSCDRPGAAVERPHARTLPGCVGCPVRAARSLSARFPPHGGHRQDETLGVGRTLAGAAFLIFAISLIPGMFGGRLGELDSYVPLAKRRFAEFQALRQAERRLDEERSRRRAGQGEGREQARSSSHSQATPARTATG